MIKELKLSINGTEEFKIMNYDKNVFLDMRGVNYDEKIAIFSLGIGAYICKETLILEELFIKNEKLNSLKISQYEDGKIIFENIFENLHITSLINSCTNMEEKPYFNIYVEAKKQVLRLFDDKGNVIKEI